MGQIISSEDVEPSLEKDLRRLMNDERFHDISLECSDGITLFGCKAILATRSEIFNELIFTKLKNNTLSFNNINSNPMKVILEYLYTSRVKKVNLTVENIIEVYHAAVHFDLKKFQQYICDQTIAFLKDRNEEVGKKLLSEYVNKFSLMVDDVDNNVALDDDVDDDVMSRILVYWVARDKLKKNEIDSLSAEGLRYLLMKTFDTEDPFATPEIEIWEYTLAKARRVTMYDQEKIQKYLNPLIRYINLNRMEANEIKQRVEPFNVYSFEKLTDAYSSISTGRGLGFIRGVPIFKWKDNVLNLEVSGHGYTVEAKEITQPKSILGDLIFKGRGVYEWTILIEKLCKEVYIGICDVDDDFKKKDQNYCGWVLGSDGYVYHKKKWNRYDAKYKEGDKVTVHLDMKMRTCAFSINKDKKPIVSEWKNISSRVYPIVSLGNGSKLSIEQEFF